MGRLWGMLVSIGLYPVFGDEDYPFFGMSSKHHLDSKNAHLRWRYRDSELVFWVQHGPKCLVWETAVLWNFDPCIPA